MPSIDHFGILAPYYDRVVHPPDPTKLINILTLPIQGILLDAGGGTGRVSQVLLNQASSLIVTDLSSRMLQKASLKNGLDAVCARSERLPFPDNMFDRVIMVDTFHHVDNQIVTAQELWRVLKGGGRLVIEEPDIKIWVVKFVALFEKIAFMKSHFITPENIRKLFYYSNASTSVEIYPPNSWIIVDKLVELS
jgi:ubiquinone/menaquinone biosynthesis C-methylase UbiE